MPFFDDVADIAEEYFDAVIDELGKSCRLVYQAGYETCNNCVADPIGNKASSRYLHGGPIPFANGQPCPLCGGSSQKAVTTSETITLKCEWNHKKFIMPVPELDIRSPNSVVETKGYIADMPKVMQADHIVFETEIEDIRRYTYRLVGEPGDKHSIMKNKYFVAYWERI